MLKVMMVKTKGLLFCNSGTFIQKIFIEHIIWLRTCARFCGGGGQWGGIQRERGSQLGHQRRYVLFLKLHNDFSSVSMTNTTFHYKPC